MLTDKNYPDAPTFQARHVGNPQLSLNKLKQSLQIPARRGLCSKSKVFPPSALNMWVAALCLSAMCYLNANQPSIFVSAQLAGIGYREQELQVAKGNHPWFASEAGTGVSAASFAGNTHIFIRLGLGGEFMDSPQSNTVVLTSVEFKRDFVAPPLTETDAFNSHVELGVLTYRLPALTTLLGVTWAKLDPYQSLTFYVSVSTPTDNPVQSCPQNAAANCMVTYQRVYTPLVYSVNPPQVYYTQVTQVAFNPRATMNLIRDLPADALPFINFKIAGSQTDFEFFVDTTTPVYSWSLSQIQGRVGQVPIGRTDSLQFLWETGNAQIADSARYCTYDMSECYNAKSIPVIFGVSSAVGYTTGSQNLTIQGYGFQGSAVTVTVDQTPCKVTSNTASSISCEVQPQAQASLTGVFAGSNGLRRALINTTQSLDWAKLSTYPSTETLLLNPATPWYLGDYYGQILRGWFVPPVTARYRFYMACDDLCSLTLGTTPDQIKSVTKLLSVLGWSGYRDYYRADGQKRISDWVTLNQGQNYYFEVSHAEWGGGDHLTASVEIEQSSVTTHQHFLGERQRLQVQGDQNFEQTMVTVTNPDAGAYSLSFALQTTTGTVDVLSGPIPAKATADQFRAAVLVFYQQKLGVDVAVVRTLFDATGAVTSGSSGAVTWQYTITLRKLITGTSTDAIRIIKTGATVTAATIAVKVPADLGKLSSAPLSGKIRISCIDAQGVSALTDEIDAPYYTDWVQSAVTLKCPGFGDKVRVTDPAVFPYNGINGLALDLDFRALGADPGQFQIVSSTVTPLQASGTLVYTSTTTQPYSTNIFYEPVPADMLRTFETTPQVAVSIDGTAAVCHNLTCGYVYSAPIGQANSFTFDAALNKLVLTGVNLPSAADQIRYLTFARSPCTVNPATLSSTNIECTLDRNPTCDTDIQPLLVSALGVIPNAAGMNTLTIQCTASSVSPAAYKLNMLGQDNLTISGTNFPYDVTQSTIAIKFNDVASTPCIPQVSSSTQLVCLTQRFDPSSLGSAVSMQITINGQTVANSFSLTLKATIKAAFAISPASVSPVLKTRIRVSLDADFPYVLQKADFSVNATSATAATNIRYLNVLSVDDSAKSLDVIFGGALSGRYLLNIRHSQYGLIANNQVMLDVSSVVTSVSPRTGSIYGGTMLTITGTNFGTVPTDNPVSIVYNGAVGSTNCLVQTISSTQITCRVDPTIVQTANKVGTATVFLKTSEEAPCQAASGCGFTFTASLPTVSAIAAVFDSATNQWQVSVTGDSFTGSTASVEFFVGDVKQLTLSVSPTAALFQITSVASQSLTKMRIFFDVGRPSGSAVVEQATLTLTPTLVSISPNAGSLGGSYLTLSAPGATVGSTGLSVVDPAKVSICSQVTVPQYGVIKCQTKAQVIPAGTVIALQLGTGATAVASPCVNSDQTRCRYQQLDDDSFGKVTAASIVDDQTMVLTGSNFAALSAAFSAKVLFSQIAADTVTFTSATEIRAVWTSGIPAVATSTAPTLQYFSPQSPKELAHTAPSSSTVPLSKTYTVGSATSNLVCSFAGGCLFSIPSTGLTSILKNRQPADASKFRISVCGQECIYSDADSTAALTSCKIPALSTTYSNEQFSIAEPQSCLHSGAYFGTAANNAVFYDMDVTTPPKFPVNGACNFGMSFKPGFVGMISQVKYYIQAMSSAQKRYYVNNLRFQGSNDGTTYTDLFVVDANVHEGWNYYRWDTAAAYPRYRFYRFKGSSTDSCNLNEVSLTGVEAIPDAGTTYTCQAQLVFNAVAQNLTTVTYSAAVTPKLEGITPRFGTVVGGTDITFSGTGFVTDTAAYAIFIDGKPCAVKSASATSVVCTSGKRPGLPAPSLSMYVQGVGLVATQGLQYRYVSLWSSDTTWGGEFPPMTGESVYVPAGFNLLVDVDRTPVLNAVIVEGSLTFAPDPSSALHERFFDAYYVFVTGGTMEVGTEQFPYTSKLTITLHGGASDPYLPIYGNKVLGLREGTLDMHGVTRTPTWTVMEKTALAGDSQITLQVAVDWQVGEQISIASTSYFSREGEQRTITNVDRTNPDKPVLTLDKPLYYKHFAGTDRFGSGTNDFIDMRAEVGLLTRNVVFRGDPETSSRNQYGAAMFMSSMGDDSLTARLGYIELTDVGQAFKVGRYAVHFHMIGALHNSYARGLATHQSYNRAFTIHGCHYLRLEDNVAYEVMGHTFFIEDAIETKNILRGNLCTKTMRSFSLLNTDSTPACFWITNADNTFIDNHAAGSDRYGYWFDLQEHSMGPSASLNVCPINGNIGEFRGNTAHSMGRYGLRIFHGMGSRTYPCAPIVYDAARPADPFWKNPPITSNFDDFVGWKNNRNGAIAERVGNVRFNNFKVADNLLAGIEFSLTAEYQADDMAQINGALVVGRTSNSDDILLTQLEIARGIITPRTEFFTVKNVRFFNFDFGNAAALGSCSHCFHPASTDSGARTVTFSGLSFDSSVPRKIKYQTPYRAIYKDLDGTLTGLGPNSWATPFFQHHMVPECRKSIAAHDGVLCDPRVQVRRVAFSEQTPAAPFEGAGLYILNYDNSLVYPMDNATFTQYLLNKPNWGLVPFKDKQDPMKGWAVPFVTGHKYRIHWGQTGVDFETIKMTLSARWEATDRPVYLTHNFTDQRAEVKTTVDGRLVANDSIPADASLYATGQNLILNDTATRTMDFILTGKGKPSAPAETVVSLAGVRCIGPCQPPVAVVPTENTTRLWSDPSNWPGGRMPAEGEAVEVQPGWNMIYDMADTPVYDVVTINGVLTFSDDKDQQFRATNILVRAGELRLGTKTRPYIHKAKIILTDSKSSKTIVYDNFIEAGNKVLANVGVVQMYGLPRATTLARLTAEAFKGATSISLDVGLDLVAGDRIALLPTSYVREAGEDAIIQTYDKDSGIATLKQGLRYHHWGASASTSPKYGVDMRAEVLVLSRNIVIAGNDVESWGCTIVTSDTADDGTQRLGRMILDHVEIYNCSQIDTTKAALRFERATGAYSQVTNCAIHNGYAWAIRVANSANLLIQNNRIFNFRPVGVVMDSVRNVTFDGNVVSQIVPRETLDAIGTFEDKRAGVAVCAYAREFSQKCTGVTVTNNIVAGTLYAGFIVPGYDCGAATSSTTFMNNVAHSINDPNRRGGHGALIYPDLANSATQAECYQGSHFIAYKCWEQSAYAFYPTKNVVFHHMISIDNRRGFGAQASGDFHEGTSISLLDNIIYGETIVDDCPKDGSYCIQEPKIGYISSGFGMAGKPLFMKMPSQFPVHKYKAYAPWAGRVILSRNQFIGFSAKTRQGADQRAFGVNEYQSDYIPLHEFSDTTFIDVEADALAYIYPPPLEWANPDDCVEFPCTAPLNLLYSFTRTTFQGIVPSYAAADFQLISNNPGFSPYIQPCTPFILAMNAYICQKTGLGILLFESQDEDHLDRSMQPIYVSKQGTSVRNKLNSMMDHVWDGFYSGQKRESRFPALVDAAKGGVYDITYTGTPAKTQLFTLTSLDPTAAITVRIAYPGAESRQIQVDGNVIEYNAWDDALKGYGPVTGKYCGESRYIGLQNILEFYLPAGCTLTVLPRDAVQTNVRMEWTLDAFFAKGGTTAFVDRVCGALGIHASTVKIVSLYEGSLIVNYNLVADTAPDAPSLESIQAAQTEQFATGGLDLGAPLLEVAVIPPAAAAAATGGEAPKAVSIVSDGVLTAPGYQPVVLTQTTTNKCALTLSVAPGFGDPAPLEYDGYFLTAAYVTRNGFADLFANTDQASCPIDSCSVYRWDCVTPADPETFTVSKDGFNIRAAQNSADGYRVTLCYKCASKNVDSPAAAAQTIARRVTITQNPKSWFLIGALKDLASLMSAAGCWVTTTLSTPDPASACGSRIQAAV